VYYYHYDGIGSTVGMSDSLGTMVNKYAYDAFGKVLDQIETIPNPFKYVGQFGVMDEENGLLYMRARYYDPEVGRFISKDPIGFAGGLNLYSYTHNNPLNRIDPLGLDFSSGIVVHGETINPWTSGGGEIWGYNYQNNEHYTYSGHGIGLDIGVGIESVWAWGSGPWTGEVQSVNLSYLWFQVSIFWSSGKGGWFGFTFGLTAGLPGIAYEVTNYQKKRPNQCL
jgi:RHS repeat-associated protein